MHAYKGRIIIRFLYTLHTQGYELCKQHTVSDSGRQKRTRFCYGIEEKMYHGKICGY